MKHTKQRGRWSLMLTGLFASVLAMPVSAQDINCNFDQGKQVQSPVKKSAKRNNTNSNKKSSTARSASNRSSANASFFALPIYPARVVAVNGDVVLLERAGQVLSSPRRLSALDSLDKGDVIQTRSRAFVSLRFGDGTENVLPSNAKIQLQEATKGVARVVLLNGSIESRVTRQPNAKRNTFEIQLPAVTVGVRGTHFKINTDSSQQWLSVESGLVQVQKRDTCESPLLIGAGQGVTLNQAVTAVKDLIDAPKWLGMNQAQREKNRLVFNVQPVEGATRYRAQVANDERFLDIQQETLGSSTELVFRDDDLPNGFHYVRFSAIDADGVEGKTQGHLFLRNRDSN